MGTKKVMGSGPLFGYHRTCGNKMTVDALITLQKQIAQMMEERKELVVTGGFAAKMKLRTHDQELEKKHAELRTASETDVYFTRQYVTYMGKLEALEVAKTAAEKGLEVAQEEGKKNAWKRKTTEEPPIVVKARAAITEVKKSVEALEDTYTLTKKVIAGLRAFDAKREELRAWCDGGSEPEWVRIEDAEEQADLLETCVSLKRTPVQLPEPEPEPEPEPWHPMSVFDYAQSLMPAPPPPPKEEEIVFSGRGGNSALYRRLLKRKQEKDRAALEV
jgi:hypothetical protein